MKVRDIGLGIVLGVALAAAPALAQDPKSGGGAPGGGASERTGGGGAAANSGSGGNAGGGAASAGGSVASGGSSAASSSGVSFNSPSGNGATASNLSFGDRGFREARPAHRPGYSAANSASTGGSDQQAAPRTAAASGGGGNGERAVPRSSGSAAGSGSNNASGGGNARVRTPPPSSNADNNNAAGAREVPNWSRPRGDRPATGTAVDRVGPPPDPDRGNHGGRYYDPYYYGGYGGYYGSYYSPYYSCGYGYYGCSYPWSFGLGYGLYSGFGWNPYIGDPSMMYAGAYDQGSGGYSSGVYNTHDQGSLKLKVKPRTAKVYVDGYLAGTVDQFDGAFQKLTLNGGRHKVEVRADGYETAEFDVLITPEQTVTFQGELKRIQ
jgi:hypothetical protein